MGVIKLTNYMYKGSVCSELDAIKDFVENTLENLKAILDDRDLMFDIKLILNELIVNGALHGNECLESKSVELCLQIYEDKVVIEVMDEGKGIADFDLGRYNPTDLKSWGRGLVLVSGLSDEFYVDKNRVVSIKYLN